LNEKQACAWLVQLVCDTNYEVPNLLVRTTADLYGILSILVNRAIEKLRLIPPMENYEIELATITKNPYTHSIYNDTMFVLTYWKEGIINEWSLKIKDEVFTLLKNVGNEVKDDEMDGYISRYSIYDYTNMFNLKGVNGKKLIKGILLELLAKNIDIDNYKIVCSWVVQLSHDSREGIPNVMNGYQELKTEFNRLINIILPKLE
jgi:hypothetical protein